MFCIRVGIDNRRYTEYRIREHIIMEPIYADYSVSITKFKKNPASVLRDAGARPVAVLNHNRPAFYMVQPGSI